MEYGDDPVFHLLPQREPDAMLVEDGGENWILRPRFKSFSSDFLEERSWVLNDSNTVKEIFKFFFYLLSI